MLVLLAVLTGCQHDVSVKILDDISTESQTETAPSSIVLIEPTTSVDQSRGEVLLLGEELLDNDMARHAIVSAIDKREITNVLGDGAIPTGLKFPTTYPEYLSSMTTKYNAKIESTQSLWKRAKTEMGFDRAEISILAEDDPYSQAIAQQIKKQLIAQLDHLFVSVDSRDKDTDDAAYDLVLKHITPCDKDAQDITTLRGEALLFKGQSYLQRHGIEHIDPMAFSALYIFSRATTTRREDGRSIIYMPLYEDAITLNPREAEDAASLMVIGNINEGLVRRGSNNQIEAAGAISYTISDDGLTWTFYLRENALWSNGEPITAHDYAYAFSKLIQAPTPKFNHMLAQLHLSSVAATDDYTFVVNLSSPADGFLELLSLPCFYPAHQAFIESLDVPYGSSVDATLFSGAYVVSDWQRGKRITLQKSQTYYDNANVKNDGVSFKVLHTVDEQIEAFENYSIDYCLLMGDYVSAYDYHPYTHEMHTSTLYYLDMEKKRDK